MSIKIFYEQFKSTVIYFGVKTKEKKNQCYQKTIIFVFPNYYKRVMGILYFDLQSIPTRCNLLPETTLEVVD